MILVALLVLAAASAGDPPAETKPAPPPPPPVPSLDDLLGTKPQKPAPGPKPVEPSKPDEKPADASAPDPGRADLDRLLSGQEMGEAFKEAVALMGDAAKRLETSKDTGIDTQRVQEDVVRRLDQLIASLQQQQQQSSSSSSSSSQQQQQDKQQGKNQPNQKKPGGKQNQQTNSGQGDRDWDGPPKQEGALKSALDSARAAWGSLPTRVRDMLLQGSEDPFSARYKAMTEQYYKRLAEERGK